MEQFSIKEKKSNYFITSEGYRLFSIDNEGFWVKNTKTEEDDQYIRFSEVAGLEQTRDEKSGMPKRYSWDEVERAFVHSWGEGDQYDAWKND